MIGISDLHIDDEFRELIPQSSPEESKQLRQNIEADGRFTDPLVAWNKLVLDGHQRFGIWNELPTEMGISPPEIVELDFPSREAAANWIIDHQLGRRNLSKSERDYLIGKKHKAVKSDKKSNLNKGEKSPKGHNGPSGETRRKTSETKKSTSVQDLAKQEGISTETVKRNAQFAEALDIIAQTNFKFSADVRSGTLKPSKKDIISLGKMPSNDIGQGVLEIKKTGKLTTAPKPKPAKSSKDKDGTEIPKRLTGAFEMGKRLKVIVEQALPNIAHELYEFHDWLYEGERDNRKLPKHNGAFSIKEFQPHFDALTTMIDANAPQRVCKTCSGDGGSCCKGRGWTA